MTPSHSLSSRPVGAGRRASSPGRRPWALAAATLGALLALGGCAGSGPPAYYTLAEPVPPAEVLRAPGQSPLAIELAPLQMPERWARPQLVVRQAGEAQGRAHILETARWTSTFESELRDALSAGVAGRLSALDQSRTPAPRGQVVYRVSVQMVDFDAELGGQVRAAFNWTLRRADSDERALACGLAFNQPAPDGVDGVALATRRISGQLAAAIARGIAALADSRPATGADAGSCR